jgi:hypothetical protein
MSSINTNTIIARITSLLKNPSKRSATLNLFLLDITSYKHRIKTTIINTRRKSDLFIKYKIYIFYKILNNYMIEIPENFSKMTWLQLLVVCLKIIIYFDTADIEELNNQVGGADALKGAVTETTKEAVSTATSGAAENVVAGAAKNVVAGAAENVVAGAAENVVAGAAKNVVAGAAENVVAGAAKNVVAGAAKNVVSSNTSSRSSEGENTPSTDPVANNTKKTSLDKAMNKDLSDDKDLQNQRPGLLNNNMIVFILKKIMTLVRKIMKTAMSIISKLAAKFIFAATFPAFPFFLIMGSMYSFVKYGAFKIREM